jgi:hypothetical protein
VKDMRKAYKSSSDKLEGIIVLGKRRGKWEDNIKMVLQDGKLKGVE